MLIALPIPSLEKGFCGRMTKRCYSEILEDVFANIRSFWEFVVSSIVKKFPFENTTAQDLICEPIEKNFTSRLLFLPTLFRKEMHFLSFKRTKSYIISYEILK